MNRLLFLAAFAALAFAQLGTIDQHYSGPFDLGDLCCETLGTDNYAVGQSFRPSQPLLTGIAVHLRNATAVPKRVRLILRASNISGAPIGTSPDTAMVPAASHGWIAFSLCPVRVVPGSTYTIQLLTDNGSGDVGWSVRALGDPYPSGIAYRDSNPMPWDYGFRTYYMPAATAASVTITSVIAAAEMNRGTAYPVRIDYSVALAPEGAAVAAFAGASVSNLSTTHADFCKLTGGLKTVTLSVAPPAGLPPGAHQILTNAGLLGFNTATAARAVTVR